MVGVARRIRGRPMRRFLFRHTAVWKSLRTRRYGVQLQFRQRHVADGINKRMSEVKEMKHVMFTQLTDGRKIAVKTDDIFMVREGANGGCSLWFEGYKNGSRYWVDVKEDFFTAASRLNIIDA